MQHRSFRGTLTSNIKDALYSAFEVRNLPKINSKSEPNAIVEWKHSPEVRKCHENLHKKTINGPIFMTLIMKKVWPKEDYRHNWIAFAVTVAEILLDSDIPGIQITESIAKPRIEIHIQNIVSFRSFAKIMLNTYVNFSFFFFLAKNIKRKLCFINRSIKR